MTSRSALNWKTFVAPPELTRSSDLPPGTQYRTWSPVTSTLLAGERNAVLVDALLTVTQAQVLADYVEAAGKTLTTIYITHGHGDHHFGLAILLERFPGARALAAQGVVDQMRHQIAQEFVAEVWEPRFPGQLPQHLAIAEPLNRASFELEGHALNVIQLGHTDTADTTCLHVPDLGLVVAGDAVYNDVHLYLVESDSQSRKSWIAALDVIQDLDPRFVVAGHKRDGRTDDPELIQETRRYIQDFERASDVTSNHQDLYQQMLSLHPDRLNPGVLWASARAAKP
jgi:glyoxylase-like metal-dependent hydrolase (beta-lactamase superfamily II)